MFHSGKFKPKKLNYTTQSQQTLVDVGALPKANPFTLRLRYAFRASQVHQIHLRGLNVVPPRLKVLL
jgi:hypothetical protein